MGGGIGGVGDRAEVGARARRTLRERYGTEVREALGKGAELRFA